jgi:hypothetical protein
MRKFFSGTVVALYVSLIVIPAVSQAETRRALFVGKVAKPPALP